MGFDLRREVGECEPGPTADLLCPVGVAADAVEVAPGDVGPQVHFHAIQAEVQDAGLARGKLMGVLDLGPGRAEVYGRQIGNSLCFCERRASWRAEDCCLTRSGTTLLRARA